MTEADAQPKAILVMPVCTWSICTCRVAAAGLTGGRINAFNITKQSKVSSTLQSSPRQLSVLHLRLALSYDDF